MVKTWDYSHSLYSPTYKELETRLHAIESLCAMSAFDSDATAVFADMVCRIAGGEQV